MCKNTKNPRNQRMICEKNSIRPLYFVSSRACIVGKHKNIPHLPHLLHPAWVREVREVRDKKCIDNYTRTREKTTILAILWSLVALNRRLLLGKKRLLRNAKRLLTPKFSREFRTIRPSDICQEEHKEQEHHSKMCAARFKIPHTAADGRWPPEGSLWRG